MESKEKTMVDGLVEGLINPLASAVTQYGWGIIIGVVILAMIIYHRKDVFPWTINNAGELIRRITNAQRIADLEKEIRDERKRCDEQMEKMRADYEREMKSIRHELNQQNITILNLTELAAGLKAQVEFLTEKRDQAQTRLAKKIPRSRGSKDA